MAALRYTEDVTRVSPAVRLLDRRVAVGIAHGAWLAAPIPERVRGRRPATTTSSPTRRLTRTWWSTATFVTGRSAAHCHLFARIIDLLARVDPHPAGTAGGGTTSGMARLLRSSL